MSDPSAASPPLDGSASAPTSLTDLLRRRAAALPGKRLFTFLADGEQDALHLTYQDLHLRALALAAQLQSLGLAGERALLLYPPGLEFLTAFFGCLAAGVVAVPASLPRIKRPMTRLRSIVTDARPRIVLTTSAQWADADRWTEGIPELAGLARIATDHVDEAAAGNWCDPAAGAETLAFLQYTSGSTAAPKGVMISHGNLLHNSALIRECFASTSESRGVFWLPLFHDMGLIGGVVQTLYCGGSSTLMPPVAFLQRPLRWLQAVSRSGATISGGPNFAYDLCVRKVTDAQRDSLDLSRWRVAFNGAEPVRAETLDRFAEFFAPCGFRREAFLPCYGLAEGTLLVSGARGAPRPVVRNFRPEALDRNEAHEAPVGRPLVGAGQPATGLHVAIVDPETGEPRPARAVGEIWVRGPSIAQGYWDRPEASAETFHGRLRAMDGGPYLRTGDLGFLSDGELFVTGRLKDLIIVRGRNLYPQDIEETVERCHSSLVAGGGAAFAIEADGAERLVVVQECERIPRGQSAEPILDAIRQSVAEQHELDVHAIRLIRPLSLPKTSSGKVQRHLCRQAYLDGSLETIAGWSQQSREDEPAVVEPDRPLETTADAAAIARWLAVRISATLGRSADEVDTRRPFASFGLGSLQAVQLAADLGDWLNRSLAPTLAYEYPTIEALAQHLAGGEVRPSDQRADSVPHATHEPVAIVGIGCRFPGAHGPEEFWNLLRAGKEGVGPPPAGRGSDDRLAERGGFLDDVESFDADFFGIAPREALRIDPQQRLLLEVAWEALEDAGLVCERLAGTPVGVFIGVSTHDYDRLPWGTHDAGDAYLLTGNAASIAANRISYAFDFRGPSLAIDTACSSSLVAVHAACQSLRAGESTVALAGGVNLMLAPEVSAQFARAGFLAADGRCKTFDAGADGYVRGEGCSVVVLKPLSRALADGDSIYALIRGSAVNQDGRTNGLTAPNQHAQEAVLRAAYQYAGVDPGTVGLIEAHGTGTLLGDPIEARALAAVLADGRVPGRLAALGSVKTNIGHLEAAAGVAGLIKTALALSHAQVPASLNYGEPNPHIAFDTAPYFVPCEVIPLPDAPTFAGVSAFGFGGTNVHVVLERAPRLAAGDGGSKRRAPALSAELAAPNRLLPISARNESALVAAAHSFRELLVTRDDWDAIVHSASMRRDHHDHRLAIVGSNAEDAIAQLDSLLRGTPSAAVLRGRRPASGRPKLAFVFTGQGALWSGAGRALLESEPVFRAVIDACEPTVVREGGWSLLEELNAGESASRLAETEFAQPALFALQAGLTALWRSRGIVPDAVVGHSVGELAAAYAAGALSLEQGLCVALLRGRLMQRVAGQGKTAAIGLGVEDVRRLIDDAIAIAAVNGPRSTTVSGPGAAIDALVARLGAEGVFARVLAVPCAFHGPQMDPLRGELIAGLRDLRPRESTISIVSTVTGEPIAGAALDAVYWGRNLREPVRFAAAVEALANEGYACFVEVGPHPALGLSIADTLRAGDRTATVAASMRRGEDPQSVLLRGAGTLYVAGFDLCWERIAPAAEHVRLPSYPWQRSRFWPDFARTVAERNGHSHANGYAARNGKNGHAERRLTSDEPAIRADDTDVRRLLYRVIWQPEPQPGSIAPLDADLRTYSWLIVGGGPLGADLVARLKVAGAEVRHSRDDEPWALDERPDGRRNVVDLRALDDPLCGSLDGGPGGAVAIEGVAESCRRVAACVASLPDRGRVRLFVVTRGAQAVLAGEIPTPAQAALWGLGKCAALEFPRAWGALIDLGSESGEIAVDALLARLVVTDGEDQYALRGDRWFVPRLTAAPELAGDDQHLLVRPEGTYLITGGLGDLGLTVARWLVERGARRFVLLGRSGLPPRSVWNTLAEGDPARGRVAAVRALEAQGATVVTVAADASDPAAMAALCDQLAETFPPIRGVVHAAGVVEPKALAGLDRDGLLATLRPKVAGTLVLDELTRGLALDFFVLFSSVSSVWGSARLADYAAANAFLDAFATARRAAGRPVTSINWGPWADVGMAASPDWGRSLALMGLRALASGEALEALDRVAAGANAQATVADVDWHTFRALHAQHARRQFFDGIESSKDLSPARNGAARREWLAFPPHERREALVRFVRERVARIMGHTLDRVDVERPLGDMGLDSLMAMELRGAIEHEIGAAVPLSTLLEGPSVALLVDRVLAQWSAGESSAAPLTPAETAAVSHPLAPNQQSMWFLHQTSTVGAAYQIAGAARIRSAVDAEALRRALTRLTERHEALRSNVQVDDGLPLVRIRPTPDVDFRVEDVRAEEPSQIEQRLSFEARRPFDLHHDPLLRVLLYRRADDDFDVLMVIHHIISDFWSIAVLIDELGQLYAQEVSGSFTVLPPLSLRYSDFVRWQSEMLAGREGERLWDYWRQRLDGPLPELNLPTDRPRPSVQTQNGASRFHHLDSTLSARITSLCEAEGASPYTLLLAAFQVLLGRYSGQDDVIVGSPVAGRTRPGLEGLIGYFVNLLPMRSDLSNNPPFVDFLRQVRQTVHGALEHQDFPLPLMIQRLQPDRDPSRSPIFQAMFIYQKAQRLDDQGLTPFSLFEDGPQLALAGLTLESIALDKQTSLFDLTLTAARMEGRYSLALEFNTDLFDPATADRLLHHFETLLTGIVAQPETPVADLTLASALEGRRLLEDWCSPRAAVNAVECVHDRVARIARATPEAIAVALGAERLTYGALDAQASRLAGRLVARGIGPNVLVALCIDRSPTLIASLLGVLEAGGAYVPLDPSYPDGRLRDVLAEARPALLLVRRADAARFAGCGVPVLSVDDVDDAPVAPPARRATLADLAYVVYTSGSTGTPKGVMVTHANLANAWAAWEDAYKLGDRPLRHLQMAGPAFDVFTGDWVRALASGGTLVICPREVMLDPEALERLLRDERIECAEFVPAVAGPLLEHLERSGERLDTLRLVVIGSDLWLAGQHERLRRFCGPSVRVVNSYGLTETTIDSTYFEGSLSAQAPDRAAPIGRPFAGTRLYVLDGRGALAPTGVPGELFIGGAGVARGYLHNPSLTAERFVPDPFSPTPGTRMYRTGDVVRWREDGALEFLGRRDEQVKIRGYRIEPGEVEGTLARHPAVRAAVVGVRGDSPAARRLVAYVVYHSADAFEPAEIRRWLQERLPEPMIPAVFVHMDALPLSPNGKVDRRALPAPPPAVTDVIETPRSAIEETLVRIIGGLLGQERVGIHDDLFALGMDSILVIQAVTRARREGLRLDPAQLFRHSTVAALAEVVTAAPAPEAPAGLAHPLDRASLARLLSEEPAIEDAYPLSPVQEGMLFHDAAAAPGSGVYVEQVVCDLVGPLDNGAFERAWRRLVARHAALRTAIQRDAGRALQVVYRHADLALEVLDWREVETNEQAGRFDVLLREDRARGFVLSWAPLARITLVRLADDRAKLLWSVHHIVVDGWCIPLLLQELLALYESASAELPQPRLYRDYVAWLSQRNLAEAEAYWRHALDSFHTAIPLQLAASSNGRPAVAEREARVPAAITAALRDLARARQLTLNTLVQGAWALLLSRYSGRTDIVFGVAVSGRPAELEGVEAMIGMFINTLPLRVNVDEDAATSEWLRTVQERQVALSRFEFSPLVQVQGWSAVPRGKPLFESVVVFQNTPLDAGALDRASTLGVTGVRVLGQTNYPLTLTVIPGPELVLSLGFDPVRFDVHAVERLLSHLERLLAEMAADPERRLADLSMLTDADRALVLADETAARVQDDLLPDVEQLSDEELDLYLERLQADGGVER